MSRHALAMFVRGILPIGGGTTVAAMLAATSAILFQRMRA